MPESPKVSTDTNSTGALRSWLAKRPSPTRPLNQTQVSKIILGLAALLCLYATFNEGHWPRVVFAISATVALFCVATAVSRRALAAAVFTGLMATVIVIVSWEKLRLMNMTLHAYDLFAFTFSKANLEFVITNFPIQMAQLFGAIVGLGLLTRYCYRIDPTRIDRKRALLAAVGAGFISFAANSVPIEPDKLGHFIRRGTLGNFYKSWADTADTLWRGQFFEASTVGGLDPFPINQPCQLTKKPPNIILVHQESVFPPELLPEIGHDSSINSMFRSGDNQLHKLRVETYDGGSWLTEFSVFAGVSTFSFGSMRSFVQALLAGKVKNALPQVIKDCGYRNVAFYPMGKNFVSNGRFYASVGLNDIYDRVRQRAGMKYQPDSFYYGNMLSMMDKHFEKSDKPLFTFLITMATHRPYDYAFMPERNVAGGKPGTPPDMNEYLRRLSMSHQDFTAMKAALRTRFPNESFLIVQYGDHHPAPSAQYLSAFEQSHLEDREAAKTSRAFVTYFAVEGINYEVPPLPDYDELDIPFLGTVLLDSAGLPLSPSYQERKRLMQLCGGRYNGCEHQEDILKFHRRLIDSGIMQTRNF